MLLWPCICIFLLLRLTFCYCRRDTECVRCGERSKLLACLLELSVVVCGGRSSWFLHWCPVLSCGRFLALGSVARRYFSCRCFLNLTAQPVQ